MNRIAILSAAAALALACGGSSARSSTASATIEGTVSGAGAALTVGAVGAAATTHTDAAGHFALLQVPAGTAALHFGGTGVDATLAITALASREHRSIVVDVSGHDAREHDEQSESSLRGAIGSIAAPGFTIGDRTITTSTATVFQRSGAAIAFADLKIGDNVEAEGALQADGTLLARTVKVEDAAAQADGGSDDHGGGSGGGSSDGGSGDDGASSEVEFSGAVSAIGATSLTVGTTTVSVNAATRIEKAGAAVALSALANGDQARVEGALQADGSVLATEIDVPSAADAAQAMVTGAVASIDAAHSAFTIGTTTIAVSAATQFSGQGSFHSLADLHAGDLVDVQAARQADGSLLAIKVQRLDAPELNEVEVEGAIEALGASSIQVQGKSFAVDASTQIQQSGTTLALSALKVGQVADVRGTADASGALKATRISVESGH